MNVKRHLGHTARKRFGQNFLHDRHIIQSIVAAIQPKKDQYLVEIGPGLGALTEPVAEDLEHLTVIELDRDLAQRLRHHPFLHQKLTVIEQDAMTVDFHQLFQQAEQRVRVFGNLPYNISTPLMFHLFNYYDSIQDMHFMLQKEVVERITAEVASKAYGRLSVMMQYYCQTEYLLTVPKGAFNPPPKVTSAVFRLQPYTNKPVIAVDEATFALVVRECFNHRRKTLRAIFKKNALLPTLTDDDFANIGNGCGDTVQGTETKTKTAQEKIDINPQARPETLTVQNFVALSNFVAQKNQTQAQTQHNVHCNENNHVI